MKAAPSGAIIDSNSFKSSQAAAAKQKLVGKTPSAENLSIINNITNNYIYLNKKQVENGDAPVSDL